MGVSTGTSYNVAPQPSVVAQTRPMPASASLAFVLLLSHAVIDFLEQIVVLAALGVVRFEFECLVVRFPRFFKLAFVFVRDGEIVVGGRVARVELDGFFPAIDGFAPETALRDVDAEINLRARFIALVGECRRRKRR